MAGGQRRATDFAQLLPGVNAGTTNGNSTTNAGIVNGGGSRGAVSSIYIDGVPITSVAGEGDPRFVMDLHGRGCHQPVPGTDRGLLRDL